MPINPRKLVVLYSKICLSTKQLHSKTNRKNICAERQRYNQQYFKIGRQKKKDLIQPQDLDLLPSHEDLPRGILKFPVTSGRFQIFDEESEDQSSHHRYNLH